MGTWFFQSILCKSHTHADSVLSCHLCSLNICVTAASCGGGLFPTTTSGEDSDSDTKGGSEDLRMTVGSTSYPLKSLGYSEPSTLAPSIQGAFVHFVHFILSLHRQNVSLQRSKILYPIFQPHITFINNLSVYLSFLSFFSFPLSVPSFLTSPCFPVFFLPLLLPHL